MGIIEAKEVSKREKIAVVAGTGLLLLSLLPVLPDPFYHVEKVSFWTWLGREIYELRYGEKRRIR